MVGNAGKKTRLSAAARDLSKVAGLTHTFYSYPARFSPVFARVAIEEFSCRGDVVLDPYMGGGTAVLEGFVAGRQSVGSDINELAAFVAEVKLSRLSLRDISDICSWAKGVIHQRVTDACRSDSRMARNMNHPDARWLRRVILVLLESIEDLMSSSRAKKFCRCAVLNVGQWALNGSRRSVSAEEFRIRVMSVIANMLQGVSDLETMLESAGTTHAPLIRVNDAERIHGDLEIARKIPVDLVVTSPPYPGVHMLYHRWQVDGRKETDAPYWIANRPDGAGAAYYNFADRRRYAEASYYEKALRAYSSIRRVVKPGGLLVQLIAFAEPKRQLPLFLSTLEASGFEELRDRGERRIWRDVPGRKWHASAQGRTASSREVVLMHRAV